MHGMPCFVVHYQELALKGRNRAWFIDRLLRNLREGTVGLGVTEVRPLMGRIEVSVRPDADTDAVAARLARTFGIANYSLAERVEPTLDAMTACAVRRTEGLVAPSFRVAATRADKSFPLQSPDIERHVGGAVQRARGWAVDLDRPATVVYLEVVPGAAFCFVGKQRGPGGLPSGVSGRTACLLSGGIDSPVAAWRMMKRGCLVAFVHFHSYPIVSTVSQEKVREIVGLLTQYQLRSRLLLVPFGDVQRRVVAATPPALRTVLYRRLMFRIANRLAHRLGARALVTGEVVGQVASQTLDNLAVIDEASAMPVLRPLVGLDKEEITAEAKRIGTYRTSIVPDEDCCQVFTPRHPATHARRADIEEAEAQLDLGALVDGAVAATVHERMVLPGVEDVPDAQG